MMAYTVRMSRDLRDSVIQQIPLITPQILDRGRIERAAKKASKLPHLRGVCVLGGSLPISTSSVTRLRIDVMP
jgi:hypothetical protein